MQRYCRTRRGGNKMSTKKWTTGACPPCYVGPAPPQVLLEEQHGDRTICAHKSPPACFFISFNMNLPACPVPVTYEASRTTVVPRLIASRDSARQRDQFEKSSPPWTPPVRSILRSICVTRNPDAFHTSRYFERLTSGISKTSIRLFFFFFFFLAFALLVFFSRRHNGYGQFVGKINSLVDFIQFVVENMFVEKLPILSREISLCRLCIRGYLG